MKTELFMQYTLVIFSTGDSLCYLTFLNFCVDSFQMSLNSNTLWAIIPPNIDGFYSTIAHLMAIFPSILNMVSDYPYRIRERRESQKRGRVNHPHVEVQKQQAQNPFEY